MVAVVTGLLTVIVLLAADLPAAARTLDVAVLVTLVIALAVSAVVDVRWFRDPASAALEVAAGLLVAVAGAAWLRRDNRLQGKVYMGSGVAVGVFGTVQLVQDPVAGGITIAVAVATIAGGHALLHDHVWRRGVATVGSGAAVLAVCVKESDPQGLCSTSRASPWRWGSY